MVAKDAKATNRPSADSEGLPLAAFAGLPDELTLSRVVLALAANPVAASASAMTAASASAV